MDTIYTEFFNEIKKKEREYLNKIESLGVIIKNKNKDLDLSKEKYTDLELKISNIKHQNTELEEEILSFNKHGQSRSLWN